MRPNVDKSPHRKVTACSPNCSFIKRLTNGFMPSPVLASTKSLAGCPRFASLFWTLTWDHCTRHRECCKFRPCPQISGAASNPDNPISLPSVVIVAIPTSPTAQCMTYSSSL